MSSPSKESFLDEIAAESRLDPYHMRRKLLEGKPDWLKVLDTAAEKGDWRKPLPKGSGRGIAICNFTDSLCAQVAKVTVKPNGEVKVALLPGESRRPIGEVKSRRPNDIDAVCGVNPRPEHRFL